MAVNVDLQTRIFEDGNFRENFANYLNNVAIGFDASNHNLERIWEVVFRVVNSSVSAGRNVDLQIDIGSLLANLTIMSEKIFEYENFRGKIASGLKDVGLDVSNHDLDRIWEELFAEVTNSVSAVGNVDLQNDIAPLLEKLEITRTRKIENENFRNGIANGLNGLGFDVRSVDPETVWKVLRRAVDSSVSAVRYVDLRDGNIDETNKERLEQMLLSRRTQRHNQTTYIADSLEDVLCEPITEARVSRLESPKDIANKNVFGIRENVHVDFVTNLIEQQFSIQWNTNWLGEPGEFDFYKFCDVDAENCQDKQIEDKTRYLKYDPRREHVKVQLYRFCRAKTRMEYSAEELCPPVYMRCGERWREWVRGENTFRQVRAANFIWINSYIYRYISSQAIRIEQHELERALTKHTLYWVVVQDKDFQSGNHLQLNVIGKSQVYVGKAKNGIKGRWLKDGDNHCKMMKKCLDNVQAMTTYDPLPLEGIQLVDARILLAKLRDERKEKCALFVMKTYEGDNAQMEADEKAQINGNLPGNVELLRRCKDWMPKNMAYGMNKG